jgi:hypothetical protein
MANGKTGPEEQSRIPQKQPKKPYTKPAFRFERVFETAALSCGKTEPTQFGCRHNRKVS